MQNLAPVDYRRPITRPTLLALLKASLNEREYRFARQAALNWLASFPGDLQVSFLLAQAMLREGKANQAAPLVEALVKKDPEDVAALEMLADRALGLPPAQRTQVLQTLAALGKGRSEPSEWGLLTNQAREKYKAAQYEEAFDLAQRAVQVEPASPLPAITHLQAVARLHGAGAQLALANVYHERWPDCLAFLLLLADARNQLDDESGAVALLHQCAALDAAGQVPARLWGSQNPYQPLWPETMEAYLTLPIPAIVQAVFGWNQLPSPNAEEAVAIKRAMAKDARVQPEQPAAEAESQAHNSGSFLPPDAFQAIQDEFERIARRLRRPGFGTADGRFPMYVILTTKRGLDAQYGAQTAAVLDDEMNKLATVIRKRGTWGAVVFFVDDPACAASLGVKPAPANDAWKIKLALTDLDSAMAKKGERIGAVCIVGGPQIVPFHRLPNPTEDADSEVFSDNPYASRDDNYFVPEWPLGRLPGSASNDAGLLLTNLRKMTVFHGRFVRPVSWWRRNRVFNRLAKGMKSLVSGRKIGLRVRPSFGYTAAVWKQSSMAVYRPIGEAQSLLVSPPAGTGSPLRSGLLPANLSYFNLHGLPDSADWYGQRDPGQPGEGPDYPVALTPRDVLNHGHAPKMVFTEACYGTYIENKTEEQALSLKFLSCGTQAVVGSTTIAYGSVGTPLIAADLLGHHFWKHLREGQPVGEALMHAKVDLVQEMNRRQGYLDGEDQKTLISFVLYGDPLATLEENLPKSKVFLREQHLDNVPMVLQEETAAVEEAALPTAVLSQAKSLVRKYLPGLQDAEFSFRQLQVPASAGATGKNRGGAQTRTVVTIHKEVQSARRTHRHYARMTLDKNGKMMKLVVSR